MTPFIQKFFSLSLGTFVLLASPLISALSPNEILPIHEAFVPKFKDPTPLTFIQQAPPQPIQETVPSKPYEDAVWIPGYWEWNNFNNEFVWVCGVWRRPPMERIWINGNWNQTPEGWIWAPGFWSALPLNQLQYIPNPPPASLSESKPASPGKNYFWAPGYWNYSSQTKNYNWLAGKWELSDSNWILAPSVYLWRPSGYVFSSFYWDWPIEARGKAYRCNANQTNALVAIEPETIVNHIFYSYPDYNIFYWHWWHFHPGWTWDGCGCIPPWWFWHDWWFFGWNDAWGLWWWWIHPGAFPPFWLSLHLSLEIAPPPIIVVDTFKKMQKPPFNVKPGNDPLLPQGTINPNGIPFPPFNAPSNEGITLPKFPKPEVTLPPHPSAPPTPPQYTPPQSSTPPQTYYPTYPEQPRPLPQDTFPSVYYPPSYDRPDYDRHPPRYPPQGKPPGRDRWPDYPRPTPPPRNPNYPPSSGTGPGNRVTPPYPNTPSTPPSTVKPTFPSHSSSSNISPNRPFFTPPRQGSSMRGSSSWNSSRGSSGSGSQNVNKKSQY